MCNGRDCYAFTQSGFLEHIPGDSLPLLSLAASCLHNACSQEGTLESCSSLALASMWRCDLSPTIFGVV